METSIYYLNGSSLAESNVNDSMLEYLNNTTVADVNATQLPFVPYEKRLATYLIPTIFFLIFIIGVLGNGCLILIFFRHRAMRNVPNTYILSLAIADLLVIVTTVPFTSAVFIHDSWPWGEFICKASEFTKDLSIGVSVFTLTALSGDRFFAIVDPLRKFHSHSGRRATRITIGIAVAIWLLAGVMGIPAIKASHIKTMNINNNKTFKICYPFPDEWGPAYPKFIVLFRFACYYAIPLFIIGIFYVLIAKHLIYAANHCPGEIQGAKRQVKARRKVAITVLAFVVIFGICFFPQHLFMIWFYYKDLMQGEKFRNPIQAEGKVVIVTGSNTGIGKETALELARRKATVYMACRDMKKCEEARKSIILETRNTQVYCRELDLSSFQSIKDFVKRFKAEQNRLDILINNAGVMRCPRMVTNEGFEMQIGVNHMGHFLLTHLLLDYLKLSTPCRIVNVSSIAHTRGEINTGDLNSENSYDAAKAYEQSKLANVLFTRELANRLDGSGVTVNSLHPGIVDTELMRHMGIFNSFFAKIFVYPLIWPFMKTAVSGSQTTLYCALEPELEKVTGQYFADCKQTPAAPQALDDSMANFLWKVSEKWCRIE